MRVGGVCLDSSEGVNQIDDGTQYALPMKHETAACSLTLGHVAQSRVINIY